jgi:hypothetical protein
MDLDQQSVGARRHRRARQRGHEPRLAARVRGIDDHRQVRLALEHRHRRDIEDVAVGRFERTDSALAQDDPMIAAGRDVLRGHQPFADRRAHAALQDHRNVDLADFLQQVEVLHVAGADLDHVHALAQERVEHAHVHELGHDGQPVPARRLLQQRKPFEPCALERVGARARLERPAAHEARAACRDGRGSRAHLRRRLDRARAGDHLHRIAADRNAAHLHHRACLVPLAGDQLVRLDDVQRALDTLQRLEHCRRQLALVADGADQRALGAARHVHTQPFRENLRFDRGDRAFAGVGLHHDNHGLAPSRTECTKEFGRPFWGRPNRGIRLLLLDVYARAGPSGEYQK